MVPPRTLAAPSPSAQSPFAPGPISAVHEPTSVVCPHTRHRPRSHATAGTGCPESTTKSALRHGLAHGLRSPLPAEPVPAYPPAGDACAHTASWPHHSPAGLPVHWSAPIGCPGPRRWVGALVQPPPAPIRAPYYEFAPKSLDGARTRSNDQRCARVADRGAAVSTRRRSESRSRSHLRSRVECVWEAARRLWGTSGSKRFHSASVRSVS